MRTVLKRWVAAITRAFPIKQFALLALAACGAFLLCMFQFRTSEKLRRRYGPRLPRMVWTIVANIARRSGPLPGLKQQIYVSQLPNPFSSEIYKDRWFCGSSAPFLLFMANTLKIAGMFDLASVAYGLVEAAGFKPDAALVGLGDLFFVEAGWSEEAQAHLELGVLLDPNLAPCLKAGVAAWTMRPFSDAAAVLTKATSINPGNKLAWWLLVCVLIKSREWAGALTSLRRYLELAPSLYEQNIAEAVAEYGRDRAKGELLLKRNTGRWLGWLKTADVQIVDGHAARSIQGIDQVKLHDAARLSLKCHVVSGGELSYYERDHVFDELRAYKIDDAEILPSYGATVASGEYLLKDTTHVPPIHWHRYILPLMAMNEDRALILRETAARVEIEDAICFGHNANYYHFICEDLPRLLLFEERNERRDRPVLVDLNISAWQQSLLVRFGVDPSRWKAVNFRVPLRLPQLNIPSLVSRDFLVHPKAAELIRARLALPAGDAVSRKGKRLYLSRAAGGSRTARFSNEDVIARQLVRAGFVAVDTGKMSVDDQIELFSDAEVVAGPGGAALTNLIFAPRTCAALVLAANSDAGETFCSLTSSIGQDYFVCIGDGHPRPHVSWIHTSFDFSIDPKDVSMALERILAR
jgi:capsular polysaccharide biosynthesis protein